jgi:PAS domain S-box-containing protein
MKIKTAVHRGFKRLWPDRIRSQLIIGITLVLLILMSIFIIDLVNNQKKFLRKQSREQAFGLANNLAVNAAPYLFANDFDGLQRLAQSFKNFPTLNYAIILSEDYRVMAHSDNIGIGLKPADSISLSINMQRKEQVLLDDKQVFDLAVPVVSNSITIGWVRLGFSNTHIHKSIARTSRWGIFYIFLAMLVGSVLAMLIANRFSKGIYKLVDVAGQIRQGNREIRVGTAKTQEIAELGTAFNKMLDEISANEKLLGMVMENMPVGVWMLNEKGEIVSGNSTGKKMLAGIEYVGMDDFGVYKGWFTNTGKLVEPHEWGAAIAIREGKEVLNQEIEIECFDKTRKIVLVSSIPLRDNNEKIIGALVINVDITERKLAEEELRSIHLNVRERMKELSCLYSMSELCNNMRNSIDKILSESVEIIPPAYQYPEIASARISFQEKDYYSPGFTESIWKQEAFIKATDRVVGKVEVFYSDEMPAADEGPFIKEERSLINSIAELLSSAIERKKAEAELKDSETKFRSLVEQSLVGVYIMQEEKFSYVNPGFEKTIGYSSDELLNGIGLKELVHEDDLEMVTQNYINRLNGYEEADHYVFRAIRSDGMILFIEAIVSAINYKGKQAVIGTLINITERMEEEKRMSKAVTDAQENERMQIGMELHDNVKQILAASHLYLDIAKTKLDDKEAVSQILTTTKGYVDEAIHELRRLSHQLAPSIESTDSFEEKIHTLLSNMNAKDNMHVNIDIVGMDKYMSSDIQLTFYRILQEQFSNILKYADASMVDIAIRRLGRKLMMQIKDDGRGFDTSVRKGGIGLENIRRRVNLLNGNVEIASSPGNGCEVFVQVPVTTQ